MAGLDLKGKHPIADTSGTDGPGTGHAIRDLICLSHLRWDFVYQRPQHLLTRAARDWRVFLWEEPIRAESGPRVAVVQKLPQLWVVTPRLPPRLTDEEVDAALDAMIEDFMTEHEIERYVLWYYTPYAVRFAHRLTPPVTVYDCMDELSLFRGADPTLRELEEQLFNRADLVSAGGQSLYEAKSRQHPNVHLFASSIDRHHFGRARWGGRSDDPADQAEIPAPRIGFFGVIDERMDLALLDELAACRPNWHYVIVGPVAKIDPEALPRRANIHYLGAKRYEELPAYLSGWDVAFMPFAHNDATRFISPTKTPEFLAGGVPVVSTGIRDVVRPYGTEGLVRIADTAPDFVAAIEAALAESPAEREEWLEQVDARLSQNSWDATWARMRTLIEKQAAEKESRGIEVMLPTVSPAASEP